MKKRNEAKRKLFLDMDGVIADLITQAKKIKPDLDEHLPELREQAIKEICNIEGFYLTIEPYEKAVEFVTEMSEYFDVYFLSAPKWGNPSSWSDKRVWVEKYFGELMYKKLILTHNKGIVGSEDDVLIDDREKYNVMDFKGEIIKYGTPEFDSLEKVGKYLINKYGNK